MEMNLLYEVLQNCSLKYQLLKLTWVFLALFVGGEGMEDLMKSVATKAAH